MAIPGNPKLYNKSETAGFDAQSAFLDAEVQTIAEEMSIPYDQALVEFGRRYETLIPDDQDIENFIEQREGRI
jgi:hypothetical protein